MAFKWILTQFFGGAWRALLSTFFFAVLLVIGVTPQFWLENIFQHPHWLLSHPMTRIGILVAGFLVLIAIALTKNKDHELIWIPMWSIHGWRGGLLPYRRGIRLKEAAQRAYDRTPNTNLANHAHRWDTQYNMQALELYVDQFKELDGCIFYGKMRASNVYVAIPDAKKSSVNGVKHPDREEYSDPAIIRPNIRRMIKKIKGYDHG